jgi:hypothetical protein
MLDFLPKQVEARPRILLRVVPTIASILDCAVQPLACKPGESGLHRPPARMMERQRGVDAARVRELECLQVRLEGVPE